MVSKWHEDRKIKYLALGLCPRDGRQLSAGKLRCDICSNKARTVKKFAKESGFCTTCTSNVAMRGKHTCERCMKVKSTPDKLKAKRERARAASTKLKIEVFNAYGGCKCACSCTCSISLVDLLTMDHIDGGGNKHRKAVGAGNVFYKYLKRLNYPTGYRVLCYNCNCGRNVNNGICPFTTAANNAGRMGLQSA